MARPTAVLLILCADRKGLVATVSGLLYRHGANILHADQHQDHDLCLFFMRVEWELDGFDVAAFTAEFEGAAEKLGMQWELRDMSELPRIALFVSQHLHCLADILYRYRSGDLRCAIRAIVSNHRAAEPLARFYDVPFHYVPVVAEQKSAAEKEQFRILDAESIDAVVLARYMQILSPEFVARFPARIINVHHSFLPAFAGGRPYHAAFQRGVKLIGATSHYVTAELDDGPIIEQDVVRISHRDGVEDLISKGRDMEKAVLSRALFWHLERRILCYANKTVVFD